MRIVIDMQGAQTQFSGHRGVGRYTRNLAKALLNRSRGHEIILAFNSTLTADNPGEMDALRDEMFTEGSPYLSRYWQQSYDCAAINPLNTVRELAAKLTREAFLGELAPHVIFSTNLQEGLFEAAPTSVNLLSAGAGFCSTLHDLTPLKFRSRYLADPRVTRWY
jgi:glycosyltransferase involved in cell wall biosynthesis